MSLPIDEAFTRKWEMTHLADQGGHQIFDIKTWHRWSLLQRLRFIDAFIKDKARDPQLRAFLMKQLTDAKVGTQDFRGQLAHILRMVQGGIRYSMEPGEQIQSPEYTIKTQSGDCDDITVLLAALCQSINLPFRLVVTGRARNGEKAIYIHSDKRETLNLILPNSRIQRVEAGGMPRSGVNWSHIYLVAGAGWGQASQWYALEGCLRDVPLGWDSMYSEAPPSGSTAGDPTRQEPAKARGGSLMFAGLGEASNEATVPAPTSTWERAKKAVVDNLTVEKVVAATMLPALTAIAIGYATSRLAKRR